MTANDGEANSTWAEFQAEMQTEADQSRRALKEINLMLEQSQLEMNKLAQRNTAITVHLQQVQAQIDSLPRADIRMAYDAALDSQQRLFVMRGQLEKLQSDQTHLGRLVYAIDQIEGLMEAGKPSETPQQLPGKSTSVEMLINAQETERQHLSRQMHDGPAQALSNFILQTEIASRMFDVDQTRAKEELTNLKIAAMSTFQKIRNFIFELRPMMLDDLGWYPTIEKYKDTFKEQSGVDVTLVKTGGDRRLEPYLEVMIFRALQELLNNAGQHSEATSIKIIVNVDENQVKITVDDNGKGFNPDGVGNGQGMGLQLIKERAEMLGGELEIDSTIGQGSRITLTVPTVTTKELA
jgi:two-component system sensor histidine kinase DegS